ncbi:MAG: KOW domain-containing RNA-binding protein [Herbinix sp.]|nr:KOW domain-containing RNA-binding protein [Herbinix sp.]
MHELIGCIVEAKAGRDAGKCYVIIDAHNEYVYLVDGNIRTLDHPKKKNMAHIKQIGYVDQTLIEAIDKKHIRNEEIKRAIKMLQIERQMRR